MEDYKDDLLYQYVEHITQEYRHFHRAALIMCMPHDIKNGHYLNLLTTALRLSTESITLTEEIKNIITAEYTSAKDISAAVEKWKAIATVKYLEKALKCAKPIFESVPGTFTATHERYLVTIENAKIPEGIRRVFLCEDLSAKDTSEGFLLYHGVVTQAGTKVCVVMGHCDTDYERTFNADTRYTVYEQPDIYEFESEMQGCRIFADDKTVQEKLFFNGTPAPPVYVDIPRPPNTNDLQYLAMQMAAGMTPEKLFLLLGTPGSGKTETLVKLLEFLQQSGSGPILVCTPTNAAADVVTERLVQRHNIPIDSFRRIMSTLKNPALVSKEVKDACFLGTLNKDNSEVFFIPKRMNMIVNRDIIICTIGICSRLQSIGKRHFEWIIVDEAAQTSELDTGIPLSLFCGKNTKVVLAGDPSQLGKVSLSRALSKYDEEVNMSTILRLSRLPLYEENQSCMVTLIDNYRAEDNICDLYNYTMYGGQLRATQQEGHDSLHGSPILDNQEIPIRFHNVLSNEREAVTGSICNPLEATLVVQYIEKALQNGLDPSEIGVVTPYRAQVIIIRDLLDKKNILYGIDVNTVATVQGTERRLVICSFVRSFGIGFLRDNRRPNTMISTAKHMLIMLGNAENLSRNSPYFQQLLGLIDAKGCFFED